MQITYIDFPELPALGLKAIKMERLGRIVVLAGKNGAGKTRLLGRVSAWTNEKLTCPVISRDEFCRSFWARQDNAQNFAALRQKAWWRDGAAWEKAVFDLELEEHQKERLPETREALFEIGFDSDSVPQIVRFVPKGIQITDPNNLAPAQLQEQARKAESVGVSDLDKSVLARIQALQNRWWNATHARSSMRNDAKEEAIRDYEGLCLMVERFLGTKLDRSGKDEATLFGFPVGKAQMSDGQRVLLQFCVAIHAQARKLSELIVIMDEPENHLHPGAMLDAINEIRRALTHGQIWIATHSVPLLSNFDPDSIWWMDNGTVKHAGSQPEVVLQSLVGDEERIDRLGDFLGLPAALAANNFAYQCLLNPQVLNTGGADPQALQIQRIIGTLRPGESLSVLDFGAGRGRLISAIRESGQPIDNILRRIDYKAYDNSTFHRIECVAAIERLYGDSRGHYFGSERELREALPAQSIDVCVMCNVLHEIDTTDWQSLFGNDGPLQRVLKRNGYLLLVEDMEMRVGEKAHARGFLVLDTPELKRLFSVGGREAEFVTDDARGDGRLKAHLIPSSFLGRVNAESVRQAIELSRDRSLDSIKRLRASATANSYRDGRRHAFHVQQFANAQLALE